MPPEINGWLLSVYPDQNEGAVLWLLGEDGARLRLSQPFSTTFYIAGDPQRLRNIQKFLQEQEYPPETSFTTRRELYDGKITVLQIQTTDPVNQQRLFFDLKKRFKRVQFYDASIPFSIRYTVARRIFPLAFCRVDIAEGNIISQITTLDDPWEIQNNLPPIRRLTITPDVVPDHAEPRLLRISTSGGDQQLLLDDPVTVIETLTGILTDSDPDLIVAPWGDSWLFPHLAALAENTGIAFNPNRDPHKPVLTKKALTYHSYGSVYHRAAQTYLFGRWHVDPQNSAMGAGMQFDLQAAIEMARVTGVDLQTAARNSPGSGFTAMQIREALRREILIPIHKRQTERFKTAMELKVADSGGMSYRPVVGLHRNVAELDFFSMYPSIMAGWNISGETVGVEGTETRYVPQTNVPINQDAPGLVAAVLRPLLKKRLAVKRKLAQLQRDDPRRAVLQGTADALKWLGYVSFGYQGFKNNLFGNIQAHEAITAIGREMLTRAKEAAHEMGFTVLGANTDSIFVQKVGVEAPEDFRALIEEINYRTDLIIELEGVFRWLAFLPAKLNPRVGVGNRYFGIFQDGEVKVRGLAQRRSDTPAWIATVEAEVLGLLAEHRDQEQPANLVPIIVSRVREHIQELREERLPLVDLVVTKKLSQELESYTNPVESAKAATQLMEEGKEINMGQRVKFVYTHGTKTNVWAWDQAEKPDYSAIHKGRYIELLLRSIAEILLPLGLDEQATQDLVLRNARQLELWAE